MPKRIEHKEVSDVECKLCGRCKKYMPLDAFHTTGGRTWDNRYHVCIECHNSYRLSKPRLVGLGTYNKMLERVSNDERYISKGIKVVVGKEEFLDWFVPRFFKHCMVDRINNDGNYEISNMQLLSIREHNAKSRGDRLTKLGVVEGNGMRYCYGCSSLKGHDNYHKKKRKISESNPLGLEERCKNCRREQRREHNKRNKNNGVMP